MQYLPVHWYEGLFLRPHHFQAADRHLAELLHTSLEFDQPYGYGIRSIEIDAGRLSESRFAVQALRARMGDGTVIDLDVGQKQLDEIDLEPAFRKRSSVLVYLALPRMQLGVPNVGVKQSETTGAQVEVGTIPRYHQVTLNLQDESRGGNVQPIQFKRPHWYLLTEDQEREGYEVLPLARVERTSAQSGRARIDREYIPPALSTDAWPGLGDDIIRATADILATKIKDMGAQIANRGVTFDSREPGDLARLLMLDRLFESHAGINVLTSALGVHPFVAYAEMAKTVGRLAIFVDRTIPEIPPYNHDDLGSVFHKLMDLIKTRVNALRPYEFEQRYFVGMGQGMQVALDTRWLESNWQWYVGVHKGELTDQECQELLSGKLDWKLGSRRQVESLFTKGAEGLSLAPLQRLPRALPVSRDWVYFEVSRGNEAWKAVQSDQSLAMRLNHSIISNPDDLRQGARWLIMNWKDRQIALQFALFAIAGE
jgi:type VI secretion system protein ImpJ